MNLKNSGDSTGFEPTTSAMPVQCSNQLSYEVTQWIAGQFVGLMFSRTGKECHMKHFFHVTFLSRENNCLNCPTSARIISSFDFKHRTAYNISFMYKNNSSNRTSLPVYQKRGYRIITHWTSSHSAVNKPRQRTHSLYDQLAIPENTADQLCCRY